LTQFVSPDDEHDVLETCREFKIKIHSKELCVRLVIYQESSHDAQSTKCKKGGYWFLTSVAMQTIILWEVTICSFSLKLEAADLSETPCPTKTYITIQKTEGSTVINATLRWAFSAF
jgi:hypothetical protein